MGLEVSNLLSRGFPAQAVVGAIAYEPITPEKESKPGNEGRKVVRFEEKAACGRLTIDSFADTTYFTRECLLIFPGPDVFDC